MEKFGLLNLLKSLEGLSLTGNRGENDDTSSRTESDKNENAAKTVKQHPAETTANETTSLPNVMSDLLQRHEQISNRVKNRK